MPTHNKIAQALETDAPIGQLINQGMSDDNIKNDRIAENLLAEIKPTLLSLDIFDDSIEQSLQKKGLSELKLIQELTKKVKGISRDEMDDMKQELLCRILDIGSLAHPYNRSLQQQLGVIEDKKGTRVGRR